MIEAADVIILLFLIFLITAIINFFQEIPITESGIMAFVVMIIWAFKFNTLTIISYSPLLAMLYSALIYAVVGILFMEIYNYLFSSKSSIKSKRPHRKSH